MSAVDAGSQFELPDSVATLDPKTAYVQPSMKSFDGGALIDIPKVTCSVQGRLQP